MKLWYRKPAERWPEALPVGNGRLGGMVFGRTKAEMIQLNEDSVWSGKPLNRINPDAAKHLGEIRRMIREGRMEQAERLSMYALSGTPNSQRAYQTAGELYLNFHGTGPEEKYQRELNLEEGIVSTDFTSMGCSAITGHMRQEKKERTRYGFWPVRKRTEESASV